MDKPTFGIKPHVLYKANPRSIANEKMAHIDDQNPYNQAYGQYLMFTVRDDSRPDFDGSHFMVDTYLVERPYASTLDGRIAKIADFGEVTYAHLMHMSWACYYRSICELTEENAGFFKEVCDLTEMRLLQSSEHGDYDEADCVFGAHLACELGFSWNFGDIGLDLVRKDADIMPHLKAERLANDMAETGLIPQYPLLWRVQDFEKYVFEHRDDPGVLAVWDKWHERCEETLAWVEAHQRNMCTGQLALFDDDELEALCV